jgi:hypothetical protein
VYYESKETLFLQKKDEKGFFGIYLPVAGREETFP